MNSFGITLRCRRWRGLDLEPVHRLDFRREGLLNESMLGHQRESAKDGRRNVNRKHGSTAALFCHVFVVSDGAMAKQTHGLPEMSLTEMDEGFKTAESFSASANSDADIPDEAALDRSRR